MASFETELRGLLNKYGMEGKSNTSELILAMYMTKCLEAFNDAVPGRFGERQAV